MTIPPAVDSTELHIGADETTVTCRHGTELVETMTLLMGSGKTARDFFRHAPPQSLEMENAIMAVEDELMRSRALVVQGSALITSDAAIREIAQWAGLEDGASRVLSLEAVERQFDLLAALVMGRPASSAGIPSTSAFAATLLILREFMHHLQFKSITITRDKA